MSNNHMSGGAGNVAKNLIEAHGSALSEVETSFLASVEEKPNVWGECVSALVLQRSLGKHADALNSAASASERYAKSLARATWALVAATAVLALIEIIRK